VIPVISGFGFSQLEVQLDIQTFELNSNINIGPPSIWQLPV
jgi:hypothetical protein